MGAFRFFIRTVSVKLIWWLKAMEQHETATMLSIFLFLPTELGGGSSSSGGGQRWVVVMWVVGGGGGSLLS